MIDGAMGTEIQTYKLQDADYRGTNIADCPITLLEPVISTLTAEESRKLAHLSSGQFGVKFGSLFPLSSSGTP